MTTPEGGFDYGQLLTDITDYCGRTGLFDSVQSFELDGNIGQFVAAVFPAGPAMEPVEGLSGTNVTSLRVTFVIRLYLAVSQQTPDVIDPKMVNATAVIMRKFNEGFTFTETIYGIDILGEQGVKLAAHCGYLKVGSPEGSALYRIMDITVPVLLANVWQQVR
jgi:hypothetical protein